MKKWVAVLALLALTLTSCREAEQGGGTAVAIRTIGGMEAKESKTIHVTREQVYQGDLILVNKTHPVKPSAVQTDVVHLNKRAESKAEYRLLDSTIRLSRSVTEAFEEMVRAAREEGITHFMINSGYRNREEQKALYLEKGAEYALPAGYSEHNTGLALDIGSTLGEMGQAPEGKWLRSNAWRYGFILRYPKDKDDVTGIQYEPWHFRYVGLPHSAVMDRKGFVLEEYWDYLKKQHHLSVTLDGKAYELHYYPVAQTASIPVPSNRRYRLSGDNKDGILVTVYP